MNYPFVSIIFPTFNGWQDTKECLESIARFDYPKDKIEIIVVDNASTDETVEKILRYKDIKILRNKENLGFSRAVNLGVRKSKGEYLLITNNDVIFDKNYLRILVEFLEIEPLAGIVGGKVYYTHPRGKIAFAGARFNFYTGLLRLGKYPDQICQTDWVSGCNMLLRRQVWRQISGFDEKFFFYFEDLDLCLRAKRAGWKIIYHPKAILFHREGAAIDRQVRQKKAEYYYYGKTRVLFKHASKLQLASSLLFQFTLGLAHQLLILKHQNYTPAIEALVKNIKELNFTIQQSLTPKLKSHRLPFPSDLPSITIVFPALNGKVLISQVLNSIKNQNYPAKKIEVIVIDNASTDGTPDLIENKFPWVKLIKLTKNTGSAPPVTMGTKIARGDYLLATNDDVILEKNCLRELVKLTLSDPRIGIATGKMLDLASPHKPLFFGFRVNPYLGYHTFDFRDSDKIRECDWAPGACIFVKKTLMEKAGYFDDDYIFCGDDHDFCFQVRSLGYKIMYTPQAAYYHGFTRAKGENGPSQENLFAHYRGKIRFMIKNATLLEMSTFFPTQILFGPFYSFFKFGHKTFFPIVKAIVWNINHLNNTLIARQKAKKLKSI